MLLQKRIHEWSKTLPPWQRDLLRRLAAGPLGDSDRREVLAILTGTKGAPAALSLELADLPADGGEHGQVELRGIGSLRNVNCLAEDQTLPLQPGLNVVFGKNGTGKSGHGRLLRGVCRAAEREEILPNVFEPTKAAQPQTAEFVLDVDGAQQAVSVDLAATPDRVLSAISVFDASCARVYLTKPNVITYVPRPLTLLKSLADEQDAMAADLHVRMDGRRTALPQLPELDATTRAGAALAEMNAGSDVKALEQLATLTEAELTALQRLETAAAAIRADKSGELEAAARMRAAGARAAATAIRNAAALVDDQAVARIADVRGQFDAATKVERELADRAFADQRFPGTGQEPWQDMWRAAKRFVEAGGGVFPSDEPAAACPLCQQELGEAAQSRIGQFEEFVRSELRERVGKLERELAELLRGLPDVQTLRVSVEGNLRGAPDDIIAAAYSAVAFIEARVERARELAGHGREEEGVEPRTLGLGALEAYATAETEAAEAQARLRDVEKQQETLRDLAELQARQALQAAMPEIKQRIEGLKAISVYEAAAAELGTQKVSNQLRKLQEATVTERLRNAIREELDGLTPAGSKVELVGQACKGETVIQLKLADSCGAKVDRVLSSGEQAAVATAFFLAELAVSEGRSGVVLDDPVSSLDHDHREYLARRLVEEAKKRQVVVYTHDLTFLFHLQEAAEQASVALHGQTLERTQDRVGVVRDELPIKAVSPSRRRKELRHRLRYELAPLHKRQDRAYEREADTWVVDLRKGYDQLIEEYLLGGVVRRNSQHVRVRNLFKVKWTLERAKRIELAMKKASPKAHHESVELYPRPRTPDELEVLLAEFDAICEETAPREEAAEESEAEPAIADALVGGS
jgi:ABC-type transport system involved in cytochrome c biogenesis ATPase subunit